jgi:hypothetical protein
MPYAMVIGSVNVNLKTSIYNISQPNNNNNNNNHTLSSFTNKRHQSVGCCLSRIVISLKLAKVSDFVHPPFSLPEQVPRANTPFQPRDSSSTWSLPTRTFTNNLTNNSSD